MCMRMCGWLTYKPKNFGDEILLRGEGCNARDFIPFIKAFTIFYSVIKYYVRYSEIILMCACLSTVFIEESIILILFY